MTGDQIPVVTCSGMYVQKIDQTISNPETHRLAAWDWSSNGLVNGLQILQLAQTGTLNDTDGDGGNMRKQPHFMRTVSDFRWL
jgi:hypothetical protein